MNVSALERIGKLALSSEETVRASYGLAKMCLEERIPGDFVECGVFAGAQSAAMALACMELGARDRKVHLFDSFLGIPKAGAKDNDIRGLVGSAAGAGDGIEASGVSACSMEQVKLYMRGWGIDASLLVYHAGWFQQSVPSAEMGAIAILRLDGDLYESTKICMQHLYPRLSPGGWCIADDFKLDGCRAAIVEQVGFPGPTYWRKEPA